MRFWLFWEVPKRENEKGLCVESMQHGTGAHMATAVVCMLHRWKYSVEDNEEERNNHSIVSLNEYISL